MVYTLFLNHKLNLITLTYSSFISYDKDFCQRTGFIGAMLQFKTDKESYAESISGITEVVVLGFVIKTIFVVFRC